MPRGRNVGRWLRASRIKEKARKMSVEELKEKVSFYRSIGDNVRAKIYREVLKERETDLKQVAARLRQAARYYHYFIDYRGGSWQVVIAKGLEQARSYASQFDPSDVVVRKATPSEIAQFIKAYGDPEVVEGY